MSDPKQQHGEAKPQLQIIPPIHSVELARALEFGAKKYGPWNWRESNVEIMTYLGAMKRHIDAIIEGEWVAEDSGITHLGHVSASAAIILDANNQGTLINNTPKQAKQHE